MPDEIISTEVTPEVHAGGPNSPVVEPVTPVVETPEEPKTFDADYVKALREEAAKHRVEKQKEAEARAAAEAKVKAYEDEKLSAEEKLSRDFEETKTTAQKFQLLALESDLKYQLALAAKDEGITDLRAAVKLADRELIETDAEGNISNVADIIGRLKDEYKSLFAAAPSAPNTGTTNPARPASAKRYTREDLGKMSPERRVELLEKGELSHLL